MKKEDVKYIVVHCSATRENMNYLPSQLDRDHRLRGFNGAGYHFYITKDGYIHSMRPVNVVGAHCKGYNHISLGVCYEGGIKANGEFSDTRTEAQHGSLYTLLRLLKQDFPFAKIVGHRDLSSDKNGDGIIDRRDWVKACPCFDVTKEYRF